LFLVKTTKNYFFLITNLFEKAFSRSLVRKSEKEILKALKEAEPKIQLARRRGKIYEPDKGPFRRVIKAFPIDCGLSFV
jgi:hypothetical protein